MIGGTVWADGEGKNGVHKMPGSNVFEHAAMTATKGSELRVVAEYRAMDQLVEQTTIAMPRREAIGMLLGGEWLAFCMQDIESSTTSTNVMT